MCDLKWKKALACKRFRQKWGKNIMSAVIIAGPFHAILLALYRGIKPSAFSFRNFLHKLHYKQF